jgi:hypothetical protein
VKGPRLFKNFKDYVAYGMNAERTELKAIWLRPWIWARRDSLWRLQSLDAKSKTARIDSSTLMRGHQSRPITQASSSKESVRSSVEIHLAAKLGVHEDNVADGQHHAKAPPDQANG